MTRHTTLVQVIRLLVPHIRDWVPEWPPKRCALRALRVRVRGLLLGLEQLDPCLTEYLATALLHILEAALVERAQCLRVAELHLLRGHRGNWDLAAAWLCAHALARWLGRGVIRRVIDVVEGVGAARGALAVGG